MNAKIDKYIESYPEIFPEYYFQYDGILNLVEKIPDSSDLPEKHEFERFQSLLSPLIKIINYKSQKPFPENCYILIKLIAEIKEVTPSNQLSEYFKQKLEKLLSIDGIGLPIASAIMHFCHPIYFPIVDRYVEAACKYLVKEYNEIFNQEKFIKIRLPAANTSLKNKINKYQLFIDFINKIRDSLLENNKSYTLKEIDNALMVLGRKKKIK